MELEGRALPSVVTIDFEGLGDRAVVDNQYRTLGADFNGSASILTQAGSLNTPFPPVSGVKVIYDDPANGGGTVRVDAVGGTWKRVGGYVTGNRNIQMTAYDAQGAVLGSRATGGANYAGVGSPNILLEVNAAKIAYVTFVGGGNSFTVDDFRFDLVRADLTGTAFSFSVMGSGGTFTNDILPVGLQFSVTGTVENKGEGDATQFDVGLYASTDATIDPTADTFIGTLTTITSLAAGTSRSFTANATLPLTLPSTFFGKIKLGLVVDGANAVEESDETNNWNQSPTFGFGGRDNREVQLYDPIAERKAIPPPFATRAAAEAYLTTNGFTSPPPPILGRPVDLGWSRPTAAPTFSRYNGMTMPAGAFRMQAGFTTDAAGKTVILLQGAEAGFNPAGIAVVIGEPSPRSIWSNGFGWLNYVRQYHDRF